MLGMQVNVARARLDPGCNTQPHRQAHTRTEARASFAWATDTVPPPCRLFSMSRLPWNTGRASPCRDCRASTVCDHEPSTSTAIVSKVVSGILVAVVVVVVVVEEEEEEEEEEETGAPQWLC
jgi:hypothetical protein